MRQKKGKLVLALIGVFAMLAFASPGVLAEDRGDMPAEDDFFWDVFAEMTTPEDYAGCVSALNSYVTSHPEEFGAGDRVDQIVSEMTEMCSQVGLMKTEMEAGMTSEGVATSLFDAGNTNWHAISGLYFQKSENGSPMGRISFSETIDFMSYRFFSFMNNFGNLVQFNDGYISLNAAMVPEMINYGASLTMYGLDFEEVPDIYVSNGSVMRKAVEGVDLSEISYDASAGTLTFTPGHFSSFKVVEKGSGLRTMRISSVQKSSIAFRSGRTFKITVKGRNLYRRGEDVSCMLGFHEATRIHAGRAGKKIKCTFEMDDYSQGSTYPLTISIPGTGEVTKTSAVRFR